MWWFVQFVTRFSGWGGTATKAHRKHAGNRAKSGSHYLYAFRYHDGGKEALFKVGKTCNLVQRLRAYRTLIPDGTWFHTVECKDMHVSEKILHAMLKRQGYHVEREIFRGNSDVVRSLMDLVREMDRIIYHNGNTSKTIDDVTEFLKCIQSK